MVSVGGAASPVSFLPLSLSSSSLSSISYSPGRKIGIRRRETEETEGEEQTREERTETRVERTLAEENAQRSGIAAKELGVDEAVESGDRRTSDAINCFSYEAHDRLITERLR